MPTLTHTPEALKLAREYHASRAADEQTIINGTAHRKAIVAKLLRLEGAAWSVADLLGISQARIWKIHREQPTRGDVEQATRVTELW